MTPKELAKRLRRGEQWELAMPFPTDQERERFEAHYGIKWTEIQTLPISSGTRIHLENAYKRHAATWMAAKAALSAEPAAQGAKPAMWCEPDVIEHMSPMAEWDGVDAIECVLLREKSERHTVPLYTAPPAQPAQHGSGAARYINTGSPRWDSAAFKAWQEGNRPGSHNWMKRMRELLATKPAQPSERVPDPETACAMWIKPDTTEAESNAFLAGARAMLAATPAAPAEEGDGKEGVR